MRTSIQIQDGEEIRNVNMLDFFYGVTEILEALLEQGDSFAAENIILEKDYDLNDLREFINQHPVSSDELKELIKKISTEHGDYCEDDDDELYLIPELKN